MVPSREIVIESSGESLRFRLGAGAQIAGCLIGFAGICWLTMSTAAAITQYLYPEAKAVGPSATASREENLSDDERLQFAHSIELLEDQAAAALGLAKLTLRENQNLKQKLAELETAPASESIRANSYPGFPQPVSSETADSPAQMHVHRLLQALETKIAESDAMRRELNDQRAKNIELVETAEIRQEKTRRTVRHLVDALSLASDGLEGLFNRLGIDSKRLISDIESAYSGAGGLAFPSAGPATADSHSGSALAQDDIAPLVAAVERLNGARLAFQTLPLGHPIAHSNRFTDGFGYRIHPVTGHRQHHNGADFAAPLGTPVRATGDGVVVFAGRNGAYGKTVKIRHGGGIETLYAHLSKIHVKINQRVSRNQRIAAMGSTGLSTGSHLHYEVRIQGKAVNPMQFIKAK